MHCAPALCTRRGKDSLMTAQLLPIAPSLAQGHEVFVPRLETILNPCFITMLSPDARQRIREVDGATVEVPSLMAHINPAMLATMSPFHLERIRMLDERNYPGLWAKAPELYLLLGVVPTPQFLARAALALKMYGILAVIWPDGGASLPRPAFGIFASFLAIM
jgi:hypothetical protein